MTATTIRDLVTEAMTRNGVIRDGGFSLTPREADRALRVAQQMLLNLPGSQWWTEVDVTADYTAGENERIRVNTLSSITVTIPTIFAGSKTLQWCCGQTTLICEDNADRAPRDGARIHVADLYADSKLTLFYRADIAQWTQATDLTLDSECPLSDEFNEGLIAMLALRLSAPDWTPDAMTARNASSAETKMRARFGRRQEMAVDLTLVNTSSNKGYYSPTGT